MNERESNLTRRLTADQQALTLSASTAASTSAPCTVLDGRYVLGAPIGEGGMGLVFLSHDSRLNRTVAIKRLLPEFAGNAEQRAMFRQEAELMANLRHPNVVAVHDTGGWDSTPYLVMPFIEGANLTRWAREHGGPPLPVDVAMGLLGQALAGVEAMHGAGVVHGDIKPSNLLVSESLEVILVDLGLSRLAQTHYEPETISGTPGYLAPELIQHSKFDPALSHKADIYALGVTAYWLLTGVGPWGQAEPMQLLHRQLSVTPPAPSQQRPDLPLAFDAPILESLSVNPALRPDVSELRRKLLDAAQQCRRSDQRLIVMVDDDSDALLFQEHIVNETIDNAEVVGIRDPTAALSLIESRPPDLVITDLEMPVLNGVELTATLRGNPATAAVPIIVVTGVGGADEWKLLHSLDVECLMVKPLREKQLRDAVRRVFEPRA